MSNTNDLIRRGDAIEASCTCHGGVHCNHYPCKDVQAIMDLPYVNVVEVVRCKDCKFYEVAWLKKDGTDDNRYKPSICVKGQYGITRKPDWFCADAERRADG